MESSKWEGVGIFGAFVFLSVIAISLLFGSCAAFAKFNVWRLEMVGRAELAQAEWNRQIAIQEAEAKSASATHLADAEIKRARGVADANTIIGESLKNNESYLRWLYIQQLGEHQNQIIYVPTEAGLPILEAGKR